MDIRVDNQGASAKCKSRGRPAAIKASIQKGSLVYIKSEGSKNSVRERYIVVDVDDEHCVVQKFVKSQLRSKRYSLKLTEVYPVCPESIVIPGQIRGIEDPNDEFEQYVPDQNAELEHAHPTVSFNRNEGPEVSSKFVRGTSSNFVPERELVSQVPHNVDDHVQCQSVDGNVLSVPERVEDCSVLDVYSEIGSANTSSHLEPSVAEIDNGNRSSVRPRRQASKPKWMEDYVVD